MRAVRSVLLLSALALSGTGVTVEAESPPDAGSRAGETAREVLSDSDYQTELPDPSRKAEIKVPWGVGLLANLLLYGLLALFVVLALIWLVREFGWGAIADRRDGSRDGEGDEDESEDFLADPEKLAAQGRFGEATHLLLLITIRRLTAALPMPPSRAATSRELLRALPLKGERRAAFELLVLHVERYLFGGRPLLAEDYAVCLSSFRALVLP